MSEDEEQRYLLALQQLSRLVAQREAAAEAAKAALVPERARAMAATAAASTQRAALRSFVSDVSAAAARAAAAGQVRAALPDRAVRHFLAADAAAVEDGRMLRAGCARLTHQLAAAERRLKEADQLSAEGLHLVDFEQTRIENAALAAKREARGAEVEKLRGKLVTTVQVGGRRAAGQGGLEGSGAAAKGGGCGRAVSACGVPWRGSGVLAPSLQGGGWARQASG